MSRGIPFIALAVLPLAQPAFAQTQVVGPASGTPVVGVTDRQRSDYLPIGGRVGSFFLYPRLDASVALTDNLRATEDNAISDTTFVVAPSVDATSVWSRHLLSGRVFYSKSFHGKTTNEDFDQYGGSALGRVDLGRDTHLQLTANVEKLTQPRTDINSLNATRSPIRYGNLAGSALLTSTFNRLTLSGYASAIHQTFEDATLLDGTPIDQSFRDNTLVDTWVEGRYNLGGATSIIAHVERYQITYNNDDFVDFDRNSVAYTAQVGLGLQISQLINADARVGYFTQNNSDSDVLDSSGVGFSANVVYNVTPLTTVRLFANRTVEPSGSTVTSGNVRSTGAVTVEHELLRNLVLVGYARYSAIDPQDFTGEFDTAHEYQGRVAATYYFSRRFRFNASFDHYTRRGDTFGEFDVNTGLLGVTVTL